MYVDINITTFWSEPWHEIQVLSISATPAIPMNMSNAITQTLVPFSPGQADPAIWSTGHPLHLANVTAAASPQ